MAHSNTEYFGRTFMGQSQYNTFAAPLSPSKPSSAPALMPIIAGTESHEKLFYAPRSALEKSPVIKGWIDKGTPTSLLKGDALHLPKCDPEVVRAAIEYLISTTDGLIAIPHSSAGGSKDVLFYVRMYKFALCLG